MRRIGPAVLLVAGALAALPAAGSEGWTPSELMEVKRVEAVVPSPDGRYVAYSVGELIIEDEKSESLTHIHLADTQEDVHYQLTRGEKSCNGPVWSPDGTRIAFTSDRSGKTNVWLIPIDGGEAQQVTDVKGGVDEVRFSPDGRWLAFTAPDPPTEEEETKVKQKDDARVIDENVKHARLWVIPVEAPAEGKRTARCLTPDLVRTVSRGFDWSPDGQSIVFSHSLSPKVDDWPTADLAVVSVESGEIRDLRATGAAEMSPHHAPDGGTIAYVQSSEPAHWATEHRVALISASGEGEPKLLAETHDMRPDVLGFSADGTSIYYSEPHGTTEVIGALPVAGGKPRNVLELAGSTRGLTLNATATAFGFSGESSTEPSEAYLLAVDGAQAKPEKVSAVNQGVASRHPLPRTEAITWKSTDGQEIEGLLTYPVAYVAGERAPLLLVIHGGPAGVFQQTFVANPSPYPIAIWAARGYAVLRANPRGSSGYGKEFRFANVGDWGGMDYQDLMSGVDHVIEKGVADASRLGVMGWSYGGFMTSWVVTQTDRFRAAAIGAAVTNLVSFTGTADIPSFIPSYFSGEFWDDSSTWWQHSPLAHVKGVSTPSLILHGEEDVRVPVSQGYEFYTALKRQGCPTRMVVYPRTPHGPREPKLILDLMTRHLEWFDKWVTTEPAGDPSGGGM